MYPPLTHAHMIFIHYSSVIHSYHVMQDHSTLNIFNFTIISTYTNPEQQEQEQQQLSHSKDRDNYVARGQKRANEIEHD